MARLFAILFVASLATTAAKEDTAGSHLTEVKPADPSEDTKGSVFAGVKPLKPSKNTTGSALAEVKPVKPRKKTKRPLNSSRGSTNPKRKRVVGFGPAVDAFAAEEALRIYHEEKAARLAVPDNAPVTPQPQSAPDPNGTPNDQTPPEPTPPARAAVAAHVHADLKKVTSEGTSEIELHSGLELKEAALDTSTRLMPPKGDPPETKGLHEASDHVGTAGSSSVSNEAGDTKTKKKKHKNENGKTAASDTSPRSIPTEDDPETEGFHEFYFHGGTAGSLSDEAADKQTKKQKNENENGKTAASDTSPDRSSRRMTRRLKAFMKPQFMSERQGF